MKVLLLNCRSPFLDDSKIYPPLVNLYLKSWLNKELPEVDVEVWDEYQDGDMTIFDPFDLIGVSIMTPQKEEASKLCKTLKYLYPNKILVAGGPHIRHYIKDVITEDDPWDYLVPGDGEKALVEIIKGTAPKVWHERLSKEEIYNAPPPDRTSPKIAEMLKTYTYELNGVMSTTMMTARGCSQQCTFCEDALTMIRWSNMDNIIKQLDDIVSLGFKGVYIFDDIFAIAIPKIIPILKEIKKRGLVFRCNGQAKFFTLQGEEFAKILSEHGCVEIAFGFESGSQTILDNIKKMTSVEMNYDAVKYAKKHGIKVKGFIMLGLPGETWETMKDTEKFIKETEMDDFQLAVTMPYKGTEIRRMIDAGEDVDLQMMVPEVTGAYGIKGGETAYEVRTKELSSEDIKGFRNYLVDNYKPKSHEPRWNVNGK